MDLVSLGGRDVHEEVNEGRDPVQTRRRIGVGAVHLADGVVHVNAVKRSGAAIEGDIGVERQAVPGD